MNPSSPTRRSTVRRHQAAYRSVVVVLECGCEHEQPTSYLRLSESRAATIVHGLNRRGVWCGKKKGHAGVQAVVKFLGVRRT